MQIDRSRVGLEDHFAAWQRARVLSFATKEAIARYHIRRNRYEPSEYVFSGDFPTMQQPLYLDTCFASIVLMTAIDQVFPRVFRFSLRSSTPAAPSRQIYSIYRNRCGKPKSTEMYSTYAWIESVVLHARPPTCSINSVCDLRSKTRVGNRIAYLPNLPCRSSWKPFEISDRLDFHECSIRCLSRNVIEYIAYVNV